MADHRARHVMAVDLQRLELPFALERPEQFDMVGEGAPARKAGTARHRGLCIRKTKRRTSRRCDRESASFREMVDERLRGVAIAGLPRREQRLGLATKVFNVGAGWERVSHRASMHGAGVLGKQAA